MKRYYRFELREVDSWQNPEGHWIWNESYILADDIIFHETDFDSRKILKALRNWGYLSPASKGQVRVVDDGDVIEIQDRSTGRPLFALLLCEEY